MNRQSSTRPRSRRSRAVTSREELIEEAAKAILVASDVPRDDPEGDHGYYSGTWKYAVQDAEAALAVFEAHCNNVAVRSSAPSDERMVIYANSNVTRGKFAAAAVHAALTAVDAHHGGPVIVLGAAPSEIEKRATVIRDAGKTEVEPGTVTAGTDFRRAVQGEPTDASRDPYAECVCNHGRHTHVRYTGACGLCDCPAVRAAATQEGENRG